MSETLSELSPITPNKSAETPDRVYTIAASRYEPRTMTPGAEQQALAEPLEVMRAVYVRMTQLMQQLEAEKRTGLESEPVVSGRQAAVARLRKASVFALPTGSVRKEQEQDHPSRIFYTR